MRDLRRLIRPLAFVTAFATAFVLAGCGDSLSPVSGRDDLQANRARWRARGPNGYIVSLTTLCFCVETRPLRVTVIRDSVMSATTLDGGQPIADVRWIPTIEKLFDFIQRAIDEPAFHLEVEYDPQLGFPRKIVYDMAAEIADDEVTYLVGDVQLLSSLLRQIDRPDPSLSTHREAHSEPRQRRLLYAGPPRR